MHLLLVEDDLDLGSALVLALQGGGMSCEWLRTAADADRFISLGTHDAVLISGAPRAWPRR
jgi:two-component system, OmpR family, response regulator QseB